MCIRYAVTVCPGVAGCPLCLVALPSGSTPEPEAKTCFRVYPESGNASVTEARTAPSPAVAALLDRRQGKAPTARARFARCAQSGALPFALSLSSRRD